MWISSTVMYTSQNKMHIHVMCTKHWNYQLAEWVGQILPLDFKKSASACLQGHLPIGWTNGTRTHCLQEHIYYIVYLPNVYLHFYLWTCEVQDKLPWNGKSCFNFFAQKGRAGHCLRLNQEMCAGLCAITALSIRKKVWFITVNYLSPWSLHFLKSLSFKNLLEVEPMAAHPDS